jgi:hypothetical protein
MAKGSKSHFGLFEKMRKNMFFDGPYIWKAVHNVGFTIIIHFSVAFGRCIYKVARAIS